MRMIRLSPEEVRHIVNCGSEGGFIDMFTTHGDRTAYVIERQGHKYYFSIEDVLNLPAGEVLAVEVRERLTWEPVA